VSVRSFGLTDPGRVRTSNQDHFLIAELARTLSQPFPAPDQAKPPGAGCSRVCYKVFRGATANSDCLLEEVARFASAIGPRRLISISQPGGRYGYLGLGVVTVWYWDEEQGSSAV
jgi:hypothetical protein